MTRSNRRRLEYTTFWWSAFALVASSGCESADIRATMPDAPGPAVDGAAVSPPSTTPDAGSTNDGPDELSDAGSADGEQADAPAPADASAEDAENADAGSIEDAGDVADADAGVDAAEARDLGVADLGADMSAVDVGVADLGSDAGVIDMGSDAAITDAGPRDLGLSDAGPCDAGSTARTFVFRGPALTDDTEIGTHVGAHPHAGWNNGARASMQIAQTVYSQWRRSRGAIRFPVQELPPGITIERVTMRLHVEAQCAAPAAGRAVVGCDPASAIDLQVAELLRDWTEGRGRHRAALAGESSWTSAGPTSWASPGAEGATDRGAPIAMVAVPPMTEWIEVDVTASVRAAYEASRAHHGFVVFGPEDPSATRHHRVVLSTSESPTEAWWPELVVEATAPGCAVFAPVGTPPPPPYDAGPPCTSSAMGFTVMDRGRLENGSSYVGLNCQTSYPAECVRGDPYVGETRCSERHPLLCLRVSPTYAEPDEHPYAQWRGYAIAYTDPIQGCHLTSLARANEICVDHFGPGWRMLDNRETGHDGFFWGDDEIPETVEPWRRRFWSDLSDQPSSCWE